MLTVRTRLVIYITTILFIHTNALRVFNFDGDETILAFENENIKIECKSDLPINYCGFVNPSGNRSSFTESSVNDGKCIHKIRAKPTDSGEWKCHIGLKSVRLEIIKKIKVRIVDQLAAIQPNITVKHNKPVTISCATTKGYIPLSYCRFEPPNGQSFSIDSTVNASNAILGKYYFPANRSLDRGDCAVTLAKAKYEDGGLWTCGAGFDGKEGVDVIMLEVEGMYAMSTASATGVTFAVVLIVGSLVALGYLAWKRRRVLAGVPQESVEIHELERPAQVIPTVSVQSPSEPSSSPLLPSAS
ncbi:uncharacterized protein LOC121728675 [Aricia agestis]|uniref:uncharacterized protein LOC121728675 n=1 Tax=Aricia agestis TaxID=91739 RepID=UPI001C203CF1|nr:uncharacterized protein LOC121728675 [Aricia agestis]